MIDEKLLNNMIEKAITDLIQKKIETMIEKKIDNYMYKNLADEIASNMDVGDIVDQVKEDLNFSDLEEKVSSLETEVSELTDAIENIRNC